MAIVRVGPGQVDEFVGVVAQMNPPGTWDQDLDVERELLLGTHPLNRGRQVVGLLARAGVSTVGRIGVTLPDDSDEAHIGFLQAPGSGSTARTLFDAAAAVAAQHGRRALIGPVDASFWYRYRLKASGFGSRPYFTEPLNPPHHEALWHAAGFEQWVRYRSSFYHPTRADMDLRQFAARRARFGEQGFTFDHPTRKSFDEHLQQVHTLLHELYADMPVFSPLPWEAFQAHYGRLRTVIDPRLVRVVHREGEPEGFMVVLPDHGLGLQHGSNSARLWRLLRGRRRTDRYVVAYLGARHPGLGTALMQELFTEMAARHASVVGSLVRVGAPSEGYARRYITSRNEYLLLRREL
ncbi:hypothetical protein [Aestuariimicrobium ganziense]|uniref:hypothetical protein n=1 Tax=Aestuariimicrobium ganziense TaxID=2773677 RepID=UPI001945B687|nr:hypothetical protein [Aestuariimicrobium ganziense]